MQVHSDTPEFPDDDGFATDAFTLRIELGNDVMQTANDVARGLEDVALALREGRTAGKIRDYNGNTVGEWSCA